MITLLLQAEEPSVVEEMVRPLLEAAQRDAAAPRNEIIAATLLQVREREGGGGGGSKSIIAFEF